MLDFSWMASTEGWIALGTLTVMEIVLGIDNIVFISILSGRLPEEQRAKARRLGLGLAMGGRLALLGALGWIMRLTEPFFLGLSGRDLILLTGGIFLIAKATTEIHHKIEGQHEDEAGGKVMSFKQVLMQIVLLDVVFSLDSVITAVGMTTFLPVMVIAVILSVGIMMATASRVAAFIERHPTVKMLALSFLLLIGFTLVVEGLEHYSHVHIPKGYIYFAMAFSILVEILNLKMRTKQKSTPKVG